jgi:AcrR family transcriptional regulator
LPIGTVFRRFPTKEARLKAVYEQRLEHLAARALTVEAEDAPPDWSLDDLIALLIAAGRAAQATTDAHTRTRPIDVILDGLEHRG